MNATPLRIVFAGTPEFAVPSLLNLIQAQHEIVAVYTQPDKPAGRGRHLTASPIKTCALAHGLTVKQPQNFRDPALVQELAAMHLDAMIVVAYGHILPQPILAVPRWGCLNVHASLLPRWRGAAPINHAILAGDEETGITLMQMATGLDTGPILKQVKTAILADDTSQTLHDRLATLGATLLISTLDDLRAQRLTPSVQNDALATYAHKIQKQDAQIDWQQSAKHIARMIRGYNPSPVCFSHIEGVTLRIWQATEISMTEIPKITEITEINKINKISKITETTMAANGTPGTIIQVDKNGIVVVTGDGYLQITQVQLPSKPVARCSDLIHAYTQYFAVGKQFHFLDANVKQSQ